MANADEDRERVITGSLHSAKREHTHFLLSVDRNTLLFFKEIRSSGAHMLIH